MHRLWLAGALSLLTGCTGAEVAIDGGADGGGADAAADGGGGSPDAGTDGGVEAPGEWRLPEANRVGPKLEMYPLHPRPDAETSPSAGHRLAHPQVPYRVPVGVQGGEWPFRYELLEGPPGARFVAGELARRLDPEGGLVEHLRTPGYGVLEWPAPTDGAHAFHVRVTDQSGAEVELQWTVTTAPEAFVFVDAEAGDDAAAGTFEAPLRTFAEGLWRNDDDDDTFAGRVAVFREGRYDVYAAAPDTSPALGPAHKPSAYVGFPGEAVTFDLSRGHFRTASALRDLMVAGIDFVGSRSDLGNNRLFNITNRAERVTFWECSFDDNTVGDRGTDNPACIAFMSDGPYHRDLAVLGCELRAGASSQLVVTFDADRVLFEGNRAIGVSIDESNGSGFLHAKDDTNHVTIRDNRVEGTFAGTPLLVSNQITLGAAEGQEVCWNTAIYDGNQNVDAAIAMNGSSTTPDATDTYVYRNTVVSQRRAILYRGATPPTPPLSEGNAVFGAFEGIVGGNYTPGPVADVTLMEADFDAEGRLVGEARAAHGGYAGAELIAR